MAGESSAPGLDNEALAKRISALNKKVDDANGAVAKAKAVGIAMTLVILGAAVVGVGLLIMPIRDAWKNKEAYGSAMKQELEESIIPELKRTVSDEEFQNSFKELGTLVLDKIKSREEDVFVAVNTEVTGFVTGMQEWGTEQIETRRSAIRGHIEGRLTKEIPVLSDPAKQDLVLANASKAMDASVERLLQEKLGRHFEHFFSIENQINNFPVPTEVSAMTDDQLMDAITHELGVFATYVFRSTLTPETRAALKAIAEDPATAQ